jgi:hypothetical protein
MGYPPVPSLVTPGFNLDKALLLRAIAKLV